MALTFWGKSRVPASVHPHESPASMTIPLIVLAGLSFVGGWVGIPHVISAVLPGHPENFLHHWLQHSLVEFSLIYDHAVVLEWSLMGVSVGGAGVAAWLAYYFYVQNPEMPKQITEKITPVYNVVYNKYFVDEAYFGGLINPLVEVSRDLWVYIDVNFIDRITYWASDWIRSAGGGIRSLQNGNMQQYALFISLGMVLTLFILFVS